MQDLLKLQHSAWVSKGRDHANVVQRTKSLFQTRKRQPVLCNSTRFWSFVTCLPDPLRMEDAKMARQNSRLTVLWPRDSETPVGDATDSAQLPPVSIDSIFCKRLYLFNPDWHEESIMQHTNIATRYVR